MKTQASVEFRFDSFNLIDFLLKYRTLLSLTGLITIILSSVVTLLIIPKFQSVAVIFPSPNVLETRSLLNIQNTATDFFGDEVATEMVLQIIQSDRINDYLLNKYNLLEHYKINDQQYKYTMLGKKMKKNISSRKTQFNSIEISVYDTDPVLAAEMANDIVSQVDTVFNSLRKEAAAKSLKLLTELYAAQFKRVKTIEDSLTLPAKNRVTTNTATQALINAEINKLFNSDNNEGSIITISQLQEGAANTPKYLRFLSAFIREADNLSTIQGKMIEAQTFANQDLPYVYIINEAKVSEIKATPERTLIVVVSAISTILLMVILLFVLDSIVRNEK
jgi:tyrosine-protein kinase Etk/Wzc